MGSELQFDGKVAIVTGAGNGLGRAHALLLGGRGARVLVNDLGGHATGGGRSSAAADAVVAAIREAGGEAVANYDSVEDGHRLVEAAMDHFGQIDVVVNNAGILRDTSFHKMSEEDWDLIYRIHVRGSFKVTHAAWPHMREAQYGRIVFTTSAAGIYGNFGQANYGMAKLGLVGLANTLALEGARRNILVNTIAPLAGSRLTETILPKEIVDALRPEYVSPLVAWLCHQACDSTGGLFEVGGGFFAKLRWERTAGRTWRLGSHLTPEKVQAAWGQITDFEASTHPTDLAGALQPIMANIQAGPSKGGNRFIDVDQVLGHELEAMHSSYDQRDLALYALGIGAASDPTNAKDLQLVYELHQAGFRAFPTFGVVPAINIILETARKGSLAPGLDFGLERLLHGEQYTELRRPLPPKAELTHRSKIVEVLDKGKNALIVAETRSFDDATGDELMINRFTLVIRGAGGWGGDRGAGGASNAPPERAPDAVTSERISENQALLYRLSGDWNPLHADPAMASAFGFERPILHGLCTFGYAGRHVINAFCGGDPRFFKSIQVRFADPVFPGETLVTEMWRESELRIVFQCKVKERDVVVIARAAVELFGEIPKARPKATPAPAEPVETAPASADPCSADVFTAIGEHFAAHPELSSVGTVYQFKLSDPASVWTLDLKSSPPSAAAGETMKAGCVLALSDSDFMDMCTGKADAQALYFGGQLQISGDVMASQRLEFLKKLDPQRVMAAAKARAGGGAVQAPEASVPKAPLPEARPAQAPAFFEQLAGRLDAGVVDRVQARVQLNLTDPESVWSLDLAGGDGAVREGAAAEPACTLTLDEADLLRWAAREIDAQELHQRGRLRIDGDIRAARRLEAGLWEKGIT